jgi:hypothetical protein
MDICAYKLPIQFQNNLAANIWYILAKMIYEAGIMIVYVIDSCRW